jgi:predicted Rossmann-fold nucleotide-binding protein
VLIAVIDTGIKSHQQIDKSLTRNADGSIYGYDFVSDLASAADGDAEDPNPNDEGGDDSGGSSYHGTHVAGIIAAEPPNPIVNQLVIMPDIEKRLEGFLRLAHGLVVFPGGVGTAEEIFYLMGVLLDPANADEPLPVVLTGPRQSMRYFEDIRRFLAGTLGESVMDRLHIVIEDEAEVARILDRGVDTVRDHRRKHSDSFNFNWLLRVDEEFQQPFEATHAAMRELRIDRQQPVHALAADLRRAFSGIVSGNVKEQGIRSIERHGPFELVGDPAIMRLLDELLGSFVAQQRMKLPGARYEPCYRIVARPGP